VRRLAATGPQVGAAAAQAPKAPRSSDAARADAAPNNAPPLAFAHAVTSACLLFMMLRMDVDAKQDSHHERCSSQRRYPAGGAFSSRSRAEALSRLPRRLRFARYAFARQRVPCLPAAGRGAMSLVTDGVVESGKPSDSKQRGVKAARMAGACEARHVRVTLP